MTRNNFTHTRWRGLIRGGPGLAPLFSLGLVLVLCLMPVIGEAADWDVKSSYADDTKCKTDTDPARQCKTIGAAIGEASAGDTITISAGTYTENLTIDKDFGKLTIVGEGSVIIDGNNENSNIFTINSNKTVTIKNVTITGGKSTKSGNYNNGGTIKVINSTIAKNSGNGIYNKLGTVNLINCTITGNVGNNKIGVKTDSGATTNIKNSIIAGNTEDCKNMGNPEGTTTSLGYNLLGSTCKSDDDPETDGDFNANVLDTYDGGVYPLKPGSAAIDKIDSTNGCGTDPLDKDQRGIGRPKGDKCDIGAFEYTPPEIIAPSSAEIDKLNDSLSFDPSISIISNDAKENLVKITLTASNGTLSFTGTTDTIDNINTALNGMTFTPTENYTGPASIAIIVDTAPIKIINITIKDTTLTITKGGSGSGTVTVNGINCGTDCSEKFDKGTDINLTATPASGSKFTGWSGDCTGSASPLDITINGDMNCTATFESIPTESSTLAISKIGSGSGTVTGNGIDCGSDCTEKFNNGTSISGLSATPASGSNFAGWSGGCSDTTFTINGDMNCTATFNIPAPPPPPPSAPLPSTMMLVMITNGTGHGEVTLAPYPKSKSCNADKTQCDYTYSTGKFVTITATPELKSSFFVEWKEGSEGECPVNNATQVEGEEVYLIENIFMTEKMHCIATFSLKPHTLTLKYTGEGSGSVSMDPSGKNIPCATDVIGNCTLFDGGLEVAMTPVPTPGSSFDNLQGHSDCTDGQVTMKIDKTCTAKFDLLPVYPLTLTTEGPGSGLVSSTFTGTDCGSQCTNSYFTGADVTLIATPAGDSLFSAWSGDEGCSEGQVMIEGPKTCTASFTLKPTYNLSLSIVGDGRVIRNPPGIEDCGNNCANYLSDTTVELNPILGTGSQGYLFGSNCPDGKIVMDGEKSCYVTFTEEPIVTPPSGDPDKPYQLSVILGGTGNGKVISTGIDCGNGSDDCTENYAPNVVITLSATSDAESNFGGWSEDCVNGQMTMNSNKACIATFSTIPSHILTVTKAGAGSGTVISTPVGIDCGSDCTETYRGDTPIDVTLAAIPTAGSIFKGWTGNCNESGQVTMDKNQHCTAIFDAFGVLQFSLAAPTLEVKEDIGVINLTVNRIQGAAGEVSVKYATADGTAIAGEDYTAGEGILTWAIGESADKTITIPIILDKLEESHETFSLTLSEQSGGAIMGPIAKLDITIIHVPWFSSVQFARPNYSANETDDKVTLLVTRAGSSQWPLMVNYSSADGSAVANSDYSPVSDTLTWADGDRAPQFIEVPILSDNLVENDETFTVTLSNITDDAQLGAKNQATVTIVDTTDNQTPPPSEVNIPASEEGNTPPPEEGNTPPPEEGNTPPPEEDKTTLSHGTLQLVANSYHANEDDGSIIMTVNRTRGSDGAVSLTYSIEEDTALVNQDYTAVHSEELHWEDGETETKSFSVNLINDNSVEKTERLKVTLSNPIGGAVLGNNAQVYIQIQDDDSSLSLSQSTYEVSEDDSIVMITSTRKGSTSKAVSVKYMTSDDTAKADRDYKATSGTLAWSIGDKNDQAIMVRLLPNESLNNENRQFKFSLNQVSDNAELGTLSEAVVIISSNLCELAEIGPSIGCSLIIDNNEEMPALSNVTIGATGIVVGVTLGGTIQNQGEIRDTTLLPDAKITGGVISGPTSGDPNKPAKLSNVTITADASLEHVIIGDGSYVSPGAKLGIGVRFEDNSSIPQSIDLSELLGRYPTTIFGQKAIKLADDFLYPSAIGGIFGAINGLPQLNNFGFALTQDSELGYLMLDLDLLRIAVLPMQIKQSSNKQMIRDLSMGLYVDSTHKITFITHTGREVIAHPVIQAPDALNKILQIANLNEATMLENGNLKILINDGAYIMTRAASYALEVAMGTPLGVIGITANSLSFVFEDQTGHYRLQPIFPAAAEPEALYALSQNETDIVLKADGQMRLKINGYVYEGLFDYLVTTGHMPTTKAQILDIGDINGDGSKDYRINYPNGDSQIVFGK
ncbi:MAG: hypothetical protein DRQ49_13650 [Gammaproteobacteria bacterium]|nr:MAG: hypothetical protein DRQ49_13650 [Gammaproteobacteria bacterium]